MSERVWDRFLTEQDKAHIAASRPKKTYGFGAKAAVLSIDNYRAAVGDEPEPLLTSIQKWPSSTGLDGWAALERISQVLAVARAAGVPVIHVGQLDPEESGIQGWAIRRGGRHVIAQQTDEEKDRYRRRHEFVEQAAPLPGEVIIQKAAPSAFFGTLLEAHLNSIGVDTLIVVGEAVSGCIRATVVDGCSYRYNMIVVEECAYDRHEACRAINLFDMHQKYADVLSQDEVEAWLRAQGKPGVVA